jgi:hypothetical protein
MASLPRALRRHARISELCTVFEATLHPLREENVSLHFLHERPVQVVVGNRGELLPRTDRGLAVIFKIDRSTELLPHMEEDLLRLPHRPFETLYLHVPIGDPVIPMRTRLLREAAGILLDVAEDGQTVAIVAISHRRRINGSLVLRHFPVAVFDSTGNLLWAHPAGHAYGLLREGFPGHQKVRLLGPKPRIPVADPPRRLNAATGLPEWYQLAKEDIQSLQEGDVPSFELVIEHQAHLWLKRGMAKNEDLALQEAAQDFLSGFEVFFGAGGLVPAPLRLEFP